MSAMMRSTSDQANLADAKWEAQSAKDDFKTLTLAEVEAPSLPSAC